jgi:hypothetical protein
LPKKRGQIVNKLSNLITLFEKFGLFKKSNIAQLDQRNLSIPGYTTYQLAPVGLLNYFSFSSKVVFFQLKIMSINYISISLILKLQKQ